jgi:hypothetical protein
MGQLYQWCEARVVKEDGTSTWWNNPVLETTRSRYCAATLGAAASGAKPKVKTTRRTGKLCPHDARISSHAGDEAYVLLAKNPTLARSMGTLRKR